MFDYDVWYKGMIIGNVKAESLKGALKLARRMYKPSNEITVTAV